jgi:hypothetical protein
MKCKSYTACLTSCTTYTYLSLPWPYRSNRGRSRAKTYVLDVQDRHKRFETESLLAPATVAKPAIDPAPESETAAVRPHPIAWLQNPLGAIPDPFGTDPNPIRVLGCDPPIAVNPKPRAAVPTPITSPPMGCDYHMIGTEICAAKGMSANVMIPEIAGARLTADVTSRTASNRNMAAYHGAAAVTP